MTKRRLADNCPTAPRSWVFHLILAAKVAKPEKDNPMKPLAQVIALSVPSTRSLALATLMGASLLASPLTQARAETAPVAPMVVAQATTPPAPVAETKMETVEQRITSLHASLKITTEEEPKWVAVAQAMRDNASAMDKLVAETKATPKASLSAVDDLKRYQKFAQAHVDGLKNILSSFETLYAAMPDAQKKVADGVFDSSGRQTVASRG